MERTIDAIDIEIIKEILPKLKRDREKLDDQIEFMEYCLTNYKDGEPNKELLKKMSDLEDKGILDFEAIEIIE
jgi:hypothetical protein